MKFKVNKVSHCPDLLKLCEILTGKIEKKGNEQVPIDVNSNFVLNISAPVPLKRDIPLKGD